MPSDSTAFIMRHGRKAPKAWSAWRRANYEFFTEHLSPLPRTSRLVDLGAGALHFKELFTQFAYVGVDFMEYPDVSVVADLTKPLPFPDNHADIITLSNTLEHIPDPAPLLKECRRILKEDGVLLGAVPFLMPVHQEPYDFNRYTYIQLEELLKSAGFSSITVKPLGRQLDAYSTIELKTFNAIAAASSNGLSLFLVRAVRFVRRLEMRMLQALFGRIASSHKVTEGYGFRAE